MNSIERRIKKLETLVKNKHNHHGAFIILFINGIYQIQNKEVNKRDFTSKQDLEQYIYNTYDCEKYVFITFDTSKFNN